MKAQTFELNRCYNADCMKAMAVFPDGYFDLAVVDPPYFSGPERRGFYGSRVSRIGVHRDYPVSPVWEVPGKEYFDELMRVSRHYIIWGCNYFSYGFAPGRTAKDRTSTHQRKDYDMNDEKKIGFSVELENNSVDLWAHGDDETLVNLAVAATANIVAAACGNDVKEAEKLLQDVKIGLDAALDQALEHPTQEINPEGFKA